jgi:glucose-1-phosphate adenylyltransferase
MAKKIIAMVLAGGKGTRLESLTKKIAKPAVTYAAKYRIIDFPLSNCANSGINTVGVLTQYESTALNSYLGNGEKWGFNGVHSLMATLPPRQTEEGAQWYKGTADAIYQNIDFIDEQEPTHVLILSGDHIYKTTYTDMLDIHIKNNADITISVIEVDWKEASRFGLMICDKNDRIVEFQEKPKNPKSNLASMGIYIFKWKVLRKYLKDDAKNPNSDHDFGKNIIPQMLEDERRMQAYRFQGYWRDVGTLASLHQANMDLVNDEQLLDLHSDPATRIYTEDTYSVPQYIGPVGSIKKSITNQGAVVLGTVSECVISNEAIVEEEAVCTKCVIMSGARIKVGAKIHNAIIAPNSVVERGEEINLNSDEIVLIARKG